MSKRDKLFDFPMEDESFEKVMDDLGVEVVKQKPDQLKNIKWLSTWGKVSPLVDKICVNKSSISFGNEALRMLVDGNKGKKIRLAVAEFREQKVLVIKTSETGYAIKQGIKEKMGRARAGSPAVMRKLREHGLSLGVYKVKKAKGGIVCIPEGKQI